MTGARAGVMRYPVLCDWSGLTEFQHIGQELGLWLKPCNRQMVPGTSAGDIEEVPLAIDTLVQFRFLGRSLDARLQWYYLVIAVSTRIQLAKRARIAIGQASDLPS